METKSFKSTAEEVLDDAAQALRNAFMESNLVLKDLNKKRAKGLSRRLAESLKISYGEAFLIVSMRAFNY